MTGGTSQGVLPYFLRVGSNGKGSFAEALAAALGHYAIVFAAEGV
jgi:phage/plasmid-associated DNA primase